MDEEQILLQAECLVAALGIPHALKPTPKPPTVEAAKRATKLPDVIRRRVYELVESTKQGRQSGPPELPDYDETSDAMIAGPDLDKLTDVLLPVPQELQPACAMTFTRGLEYLASIFPRRIEQRLTGPHIHDPSPGEWAEFGWAWRIASEPLYVLDLAGDGMLIGVEVRHLKAMFPAVYGEICSRILDALTDQVVKDKDWQAPWWLQKQICTILGISPVSPSLVADIDSAIEQSKAETKTRASALKLTQSGQTNTERLSNEAK